MTRLDLSVIIVSWNVREHLLRCLSALPAAITVAYRWEVIVVDNASADGSVEAVRLQFGQARVIANPSNRLYTAAANQGLDAASGRHYLILNPDTIPQPESIARLLAYAEAHAEAGLVGPRIVDADGHDDLLTGRHFPTPCSEFADWLGLTNRFSHHRWLSPNLRPDYDRRQTAPVPLLSGACLLLPERLPAQMRRFDSAYRMYGEDVDLCRRVQAAGLQMSLVGDAVIVHLGAESSRQAKLQSNLLAVDGSNRYFRRWHGAGSARWHRLLMAVVAVVKCVVLIPPALWGSKPDASQQRRMYSALFRWALHGNLGAVKRDAPDAFP